VRRGSSSGCAPTEWFDPTEYLFRNPDVESDGLDAFFHYVLFGRSEGRSIGEGQAHLPTSAVITQVEEAEPTPARGDNSRHGLLESTVRHLFHEEYYRRRYGSDSDDSFSAYMNEPDLWMRKPNWWFDGEDYLSRYPDVAVASVNPLLHFVVAGRREGRKPRARGAADFLRALKQPNVQDLVNSWPVHCTEHVTSQSDVFDVLRLRMGPHERLLVSMGNDNYSAGTGGIQYVVSEEAAQCALAGWTHWYLYPAMPSPLATSRGSQVHSLIDGEPGPSFDIADLGGILMSLEGCSVSTHARVHGLLGWDPSEVSRQLARSKPVDFYVHDMVSVCPNYTLTLNEMLPCGAPPARSQACQVCSYGEARRKVAPAINEFLTNCKPLAVFPSAAARDEWLKTFPDYGHHVTRTLGHIEWTGSRISDTARPRIAYVGMPSQLKGFGLFCELADWNLQEDRYELVWLGRDTHEIPGVLTVEVDQVGSERSLMTSTLAGLGIHAVLISPIGFETFSFVAHEALASGALILTHRMTGNVAALAGQSGAGVVAATPDALIEILRSPTFPRYLTRQGSVRPTGRFMFSGLLPVTEVGSFTQ
jgi:hypothetical protein